MLCFDPFIAPFFYLLYLWVCQWLTSTYYTMGLPGLVRLSPPVNGPKDPWPSILSQSGARMVCWRPHLAGTRQYEFTFTKYVLLYTVNILWFISNQKLTMSCSESNPKLHLQDIRRAKNWVCPNGATQKLPPQCRRVCITYVQGCC